MAKFACDQNHLFEGIQTKLTTLYIYRKFGFPYGDFPWRRQRSSWLMVNGKPLFGIIPRDVSDTGSHWSFPSGHYSVRYKKMRSPAIFVLVTISHLHSVFISIRHSLNCFDHVHSENMVTRQSGCSIEKPMVWLTGNFVNRAPTAHVSWLEVAGCTHGAQFAIVCWVVPLGAWF